MPSEARCRIREVALHGCPQEGAPPSFHLQHPEDHPPVFSLRIWRGHVAEARRERNVSPERAAFCGLNHLDMQDQASYSSAIQKQCIIKKPRLNGCVQIADYMLVIRNNLSAKNVIRQGNPRPSRRRTSWR